MNSNSDIDSTKRSDGEGRNKLVLVLGFLLIGAAAAVLLFGSDITDKLSGEEKTPTPETSETVLDQAGALQDVGVSDESSLSKADMGGFIEVGDTAREFELLDFDGVPVKLSDFEGQPVIINYWATWCAPCRLEMPELQKAYENYQDQGLVILALNQDEPLDRASAFFYEDMDLSFTPLLDPGSDIYRSYASLSVLPTTYFIDPEGTVTAIHRGPLTLGQIEGYLGEFGLG